MYVQWVPEIAHHCPGTPFILAGTKLDLLSGDNDNSVSTLKVLADQKMPPVSFKEVPYAPPFSTTRAWRSFTLLTA
jgi:GTPase SAR1 family protein